MRFKSIEGHGDAFCANRMCDVLDVSAPGLRAYRTRPASQRQRTDMVVLAHIKAQSRLSPGSYGRPMMTEELKELGLNAVHRCVGRWMREIGIRFERSKKYKVMTDRSHAINIAPSANTPRGRSRYLPVHQRLMQSAPEALSIGLEKSRRIRTAAGVNEHLGRQESVVGPNAQLSRLRLECLKFHPSPQDPRRPLCSDQWRTVVDPHPAQVHPQNLDITAGSLHPKSDPPDARTEQLGGI